ncbi:MAG: metalloregulator ArsR/SmtB family transcription factor [Shimia sp.]
MAYSSALHALGDPTRLALIERLKEGPCAVSTLAEGLPVSRPAVSQHLRVLAEAGMVDHTRDGQRRIYRLCPDGIQALKGFTDGLWDAALDAFAAHAQTLAQEAQMPLDPIVKTLTVPLSPEQAFEAFTRDLSNWWPVESHSLSAYEDETPKGVTVEPREGGQIIETQHDGTKAPWGTITGWEPGRRLAMTWHVGRPAEEATFLDIRFEAQGTGTRIILIHDGWDSLGTQATAIRDTYTTGWDLVLESGFAAHCKACLVA